MLNKNQITNLPKAYISELVELAIKEDVYGDENGQDITALLVDDVDTTAYCITREDMILCGCDFANEVIEQIDNNLKISWHYKDSDGVKANQKIFSLEGNARSILTAERIMLNFIQTLSATATTTNNLVSLIADSKTKLLDTRKTIPSFRLAQKYAVKCGGGYNHRVGLFDAFLIKENHIRSAGSISKAVARANEIAKDKMVEVEVTNLDELNQAIEAKADIVMLDNFSIQDILEAVKIAKGKLLLEVSGNINENTIIDVAKTGVDFVSVGAITKSVKAIDLSMQVAI
ncbi:carboxylating nicotinate-nucleotide diphosphorylase [Francisella adeliensis]|uniref:nicotinate-nucleotide diphosphorylase (carboxylating) n=1 Tax=Francisella adeliensis TaxID=2007306 RepID=A0A2Z4XZ42_9GAMM|nr:carboxylating nicotinate-nucleotide diphosphorylase [Francisella adeliensis]AXA33752.1 nicotinate-nucleotide diphosphorylase (carboxylating) [Francisella adeliensis]MBK2085650.1 carboxylating nicotinate-nucleotide diphosphorylase [Francisella adeliensis]MBK2097528.1 carboxylating nicotinate-nucleotide diphosphorylase [Francisella adeliensis]QIW11987.1 carboxylating nicotinate-nucleotide diphosphorylase [Francisella adeliensis]QIW13862.1 carboxylating nicotinate-nucleotide diphosphorylase [F